MLLTVFTVHERVSRDTFQSLFETLNTNATTREKVESFSCMQTLLQDNTSNTFLAKPCRNNSLGLCQCGDDEWKTFQKGLWSSTMSPYEIRYVDVKVLNVSPLSGPVTIAIEEGVCHIGF